MKIGILCAGDDELAPFLPCLREPHITERAMLRFYEGTIGRHEVVTLYSGVCKVNAAIAAGILIDHFGVEAIVNAGVAGGIDPRLSLFDIVVGERAAHHDMAEDILTDFHPWMPSIYFPADEKLLGTAKTLWQNDPAVFFGTMVTGKSFIDNDARTALLERFSPLSADMETAAVAQVSYVHKLPFLAVRAVSDTADHAGLASFEANVKKAAALAKDRVLALLAAL